MTGDERDRVVEGDGDDGPGTPGPALHLTATLIAFGATTLVRRLLDSGYRRATGRATPSAGDRSASLGRALAWAAVTAATAAVVEVAVLRAVEGGRRHLPDAGSGPAALPGS